MEKIRVVYLVNQLAFGGTEKAVQVLARSLDRSIFEPSVCAVYSGGYRYELFRESGIEVAIAGGSFDKLRRILHDFQPDIAHIHRAGGREPLPVEAASQAGAKVILETNHFGDVDLSESGRKLDFHIMISKFVAYRYMAKAKLSLDDFLKECTVIYNPVEIEEMERFRPNISRIEKMKHELGLDGHYVLGRVGRAEAKWNYFPVEMALHLARRGLSVKYLIVGGFPESIVRKLARHDLGKIFVDLGKLSDEELSSFYYVFDLLAHTSKRGETFGYTLAEAMAAERPVVVQSTPYADNAQLELVDNGYNGFVANTPSTYAEAVLRLLKDQELRISMGIAGRRRAEKMFESRKNTRANEIVYLHLLSRKDPNKELPSLRERLEDAIEQQKNELTEYPHYYSRKLTDLFIQPGMLDRILTDMKYGKTYLSLENYYRRKIRKRLRRILRR